MKMEINSIDYGIYIDREKAFIIALSSNNKEVLINDMVLENQLHNVRTENVSSQEHIQNRKNDELLKFCKLIIAQVSNANHIVVFGPSTFKFELQKTVHHTKRLKNVSEELVTTDFMDKDAALRFVKSFYSLATTDKQLQTENKKQLL